MSTFKKHVGRIANTDRRCVVVYMQIPGNEDNALVIDTDALPDRFHDALMTIVDSTEAQQTNDLHTLLARRVMPDTNVDMMNALHQFGLFRPVAIDNVIMYPAPNAPCPLRTIVDFVNNEKAGIKSTPENVNLENRHLENQKSDNAEQNLSIAHSILAQAVDLENEAQKKREQAYKLAPELRPSPEVTGALANAPVADATIAPVGFPEEGQYQVAEMPVDAPQMLNEGVSENEALPVMLVQPDLPEDVLEALKAAQLEIAEATKLHQPVSHDDAEEGNQVDSSDDAIQAFLDRAAFREDREDREKWEAMQPKNPVGRPRKDGTPAGSKAPPAPAPKKRGRPPKAKK